MMLIPLEGRAQAERLPLDRIDRLVAMQRYLANRQPQLCRQHPFGDAFGQFAELGVVAKLAAVIGAQHTLLDQRFQ